MIMAVENVGSEVVGGPNGGSGADESEAKELEQLSAKVAEFLQEAALAHERMAKHQEEIERLKAETRAMLELMRAA
jgi:uncharacterized small protein (DUF1192 family)